MIQGIVSESADQVDTRDREIECVIGAQGQVLTWPVNRTQSAVPVNQPADGETEIGRRR